MASFMKMNVSGIKTYLECQKKAYYLIDLKRGKRNTFSPALTLGTWWHSLMECKMTGKEPPDDTIPQLIAALEVAGVDSTKVAAVKNQAEALKLGFDVWHMPDDWEVKAVEKAIESSLPRWFKHDTDESHRLKGIVDAVVSWNGKFWHVQHKTIDRTRSLPTFWQKMERDWHECAYEYILKRMDFNPYGGTLLLTARKLSMKDSVASPESIVQHQFISRPEHVVNKAIGDIASILDEWELKRDMVTVWGGPQQFIENRDACFGTYGNSPCPYLDVCHNRADIHDETNFVTITDRYDELDGD